MKKETIGILICTLLISVAVAPAINALDNEVDIVKEPTDTFGLTDTGSWEQTVNDLLARFEAAQTQESKIALLEEIPVIMDIYGLLPEDMTVEETQELIVSAYLETIASSSLQTEQSSFAIDSLLVGSKNTLPQFQVLKSVFNLIVNNNIKLNPPQPAPWPPDDKIITRGFGVISNPERIMGEWYPVWVFNCENVRGRTCDEYGHCLWHLFDGGKVRFITGDPAIMTDYFMYNPILHHFFLIVK